MKIIASVWPASGFLSYSPFRMRSARSNRASSSGVEKSGIARKSRWPVVAGAAVAVMRARGRGDASGGKLTGARGGEKRAAGAPAAALPFRTEEAALPRDTLDTDNKSQSPSSMYYCFVI